jgi:hypothetical protein
VIRQGHALPICFVAALALAAAAGPSAAQTTPAPATTPVVSAAPATFAAPPDRGHFGGLWVAPLATNWLQGAGFEGGYRYGWLVGIFREGFLQNSYAPPGGPAPELSLERTQRYVAELELDGQWRYRDVIGLAAGAGVAFIDDRVHVTSMNGPTWTTVTDDRSRIRPLLNVTLSGPLLEASATFYVGDNPEARLSLGVCWGRLTRR